jgi:gamma-glutamylcyclotransferase (GGCT)/AIG2-like uncharacterized protein YtfP
MLPLFVYGSLLSTESQGWALAGRTTDPARMQGRLWLLPGGEPALQLSRHHGWVHGQVVEVQDETELSFLEQLAGMQVRGLVRRKIRVQLGVRAILAQVWIAEARQLRRLKARPLNTSDWRKTPHRKRF